MTESRRIIAAASIAVFSVGLAGYGRDTAPSPRRFEALQRKAQRQEDRGNYAAAAKLYGKAAKYASGGGESANVLLRRADNFFAAGKNFPAWEAYRKAVETYMTYLPFDHVMGRLRELAERFAAGEDSMFGFKNRSLAIEVYELLLKEAPAGANAAVDKLRLAQLQSETKEYEDAVVTLRELRRRYPDTPQAAEARLELGRLLLKLARDGDGDGRLARQARRELEGFQATTENHPREQEAEILLQMVDERQAQALCRLGEFYTWKAHRRLPAAKRYLSDLQREYHSTAAAQTARLLLARIDSGEFGEANEPSPPSGKSAAEKAEGDEADKAAPAPPPAPEQMSPDKLKPARSFKPLDDREKLQKWLLPLEDLNPSAGGLPHE